METVNVYGQAALVIPSLENAQDQMDSHVVCLALHLKVVVQKL